MKKYYEYAQHLNANQYVLKWVETTLSNYLGKNNPPTEEVEHIIDYLCQTETRISKMSYDQAKLNAEKWTKALQKKGADIDESDKDIEVVLDFGDGFKIVKLIGENAYKREGFLMRHCVLEYFDKDSEIFSLRDSKNFPHCTMEKNRQIKGKGNGDINPKYVRYVVEFLEHIGMSVSDNEMKHLGYVNVEKILKDDKSVKFKDLFREKYFFKQNLDNVEGKNNLILWSLFDLFEFDENLNVKYNFDIDTCVNSFRESFNIN